MESVAMRIGGRDAGSADGRYYEKRNPFTGELSARVPDAGPLDAAAAAGAAAAAFEEWSNAAVEAARDPVEGGRPARERAPRTCAKTITAETGATFGWGMFNTAFAASMMREAAAATTQITGEMIPSDIPGNIALSVRQPVGVVLGIAPWNAPMILGVRAVAMPLACGNTVVLKASEECPADPPHHRRRARGGGAARRRDQRVDRRRARAPARRWTRSIADPRVRRINFTGSTDVGRIIAEKAAQAPEAGAARARRQGAARRARRRRSRRGGGGRGFRRLHASGPDLHVDRAARRRRSRSSSRSSTSSSDKRRRSRRRSARRARRSGRW